MGETIWYKGYGIDVDLTYEGIISVQYAERKDLAWDSGSQYVILN